MTVEELLSMHEAICAEARELMKKKNFDYRGGSSDPFANFRGSLLFGVEPEVGMMIRMNDKFQRINTFITKGTLKVTDEPVRDCIRDIINYSVLLLGMMEERNELTRETTETQRAD